MPPLAFVDATIEKSWPEVDVAIRSLEEFKTFLDVNRDVLLNEKAHEELGNQILKAGCREPLTGWEIAPFQISKEGGLREGLAFDAISSRVRAVMLCIEDVIDRQQLASPRIYAAEGLTAFAMRMRGLYPRSEPQGMDVPYSLGGFAEPFASGWCIRHRFDQRSA